MRRRSTRCVERAHGRACLLPDEVVVAFVIRPRRVAELLWEGACLVAAAVLFYAFLFAGALWAAM